MGNKAVDSRIIYVLISVFLYSLKVTQNTGNIPENISGAEEILKFKKLCDDGIITQEEFEAKKKQLLGL